MPGFYFEVASQAQGKLALGLSAFNSHIGSLRPHSL
jgi:hypothetical protein